MIPALRWLIPLECQRKTSQQRRAALFRLPESLKVTLTIFVTFGSQNTMGESYWGCGLVSGAKY